MTCLARGAQERNDRRYNTSRASGKAVTSEERKSVGVLKRTGVVGPGKGRCLPIFPRAPRQTEVWHSEIGKLFRQRSSVFGIKSGETRRDTRNGHWSIPKSAEVT